MPASELAAAVKCSAGVDTSARREPVLLVPGTTLSPDANFSWNWMRALADDGTPYCSIRSPEDAMADIQVNAEYVVYAIREMHRRTGRKAQVVGFSQGGMVPRWALRFWPDTQTMVDDLVGLSPSNHGTVAAAAICAAGCAPAIWQQTPDSAFMKALNAGGETFAGVDYTSVFTHTDDVVIPNQDTAHGSSSLRTGDGAQANIATQDVCPANVGDHLAVGSYDGVAYAIAMDALAHPGTADAVRVDRGVCMQPFQPGVDAATFATDYAAYGAYVGRVLVTSPHVAKEPALACYVAGSCPQADGKPPAPTASCASRRRFTIRLHEPAGHDRLQKASVLVDGKEVAVRRRRGRLTAVVDLRGMPQGATVIRVRARTARGRVVREVRRYHRCGRG